MLRKLHGLPLTRAVCSFSTRVASRNDPPEYSRVITKAVQSGEAGGRVQMDSALITPISQTSTYTFRDTQHQLEMFQADPQQALRPTNPTVQVLEEKLRALEGGEACMFTSSGMNSCTTMLLALHPNGGHLLTTKDCYRRTRQFIADFLPRFGITHTVVDFPMDADGSADIIAAIREEKPSMFFSESPTNPYLRCVDIAAIAEVCKETGTIFCVDSTFATPVNVCPLSLGADLVLHSGTKYLAGHNDVLCGALVGSKVLLDQVRAADALLGGRVNPHAAFLALRGMKTLGVRVMQQNNTAMHLAQYLEGLPQVERVFYPGLPSHPDFKVARRQMTGFGGVVSFLIEGGLKPASAFVDALEIPYIAPSLGGVESLVEQPAIISYWDKTPEERQRLNIFDGLVRFSCGVENADDIVSDVAQAFKRMQST